MELYYGGAIDELQIFNRSLAQSEIQAIYGAGSRGKCKVTCAIPQTTVFCKNSTQATLTLTICNQLSTPSVAQYSFAGLGTGAGCNFNGTNLVFSPANGTVSLLPGQCTQVQVIVNRASGFVPGNIACYCVTVLDTLTKATSNCCANLKASNSWCIIKKNPNIISTLKVGSGLATSFTLFNDSSGTVAIDYQLSPQSVHPDGTRSPLRLNGLPPGIPVTGTLMISPNDSGDVTADAFLTGYRPNDLEEIVLLGDVDGDGELDPVGEILIKPSPFLDCNQNGIDDSLDIARGTSPDTNGNGVPDECEVQQQGDDCPICGDADRSSIVNVSDAVYLIAYVFSGGPAPNPLSAGDVDCNGIVNISDVVYLIGYIFAGGPAPCAACK